MRTSIALALAAGLVLPLLNCGSGDDTNGATTTQPTTTTTPNGGNGGTPPSGGGGAGATGGTHQGGQGGQGGTISLPESWLGDACTCTGDACNQQGVPKPAGGTIAGCENVPADANAALVCLRTYIGSLANNTWFANGYCGLQATSCTGDSVICDSAVWGSVDAMTSCPAGSVLLDDTTEVTALNIFHATVHAKTCARGCTGAGQCREGETDPADSNAPSQYQCMDKGGVKFCYDPRDLGPSYTATAF